MLAAAALPPTFPDDPKKWDGWIKYQADNPYERLCLDQEEFRPTSKSSSTALLCFNGGRTNCR
jgi:hypothetical protein